MYTQSLYFPEQNFGCPCEKVSFIKRYDVQSIGMARNFGSIVIRMQTSLQPIIKETAEEKFNHTFLIDVGNKTAHHGFTDEKTRMEMLANPSTAVHQLAFEEAMARNIKKGNTKQIDGYDIEAIKKASDESHATIVEQLKYEHARVRPKHVDQFLLEEQQNQKQLPVSVPLVVVAVVAPSPPVYSLEKMD